RRLVRRVQEGQRSRGRVFARRKRTRASRLRGDERNTCVDSNGILPINRAGGDHFALAVLTLALCLCRLPASATPLRFCPDVEAPPPDSPRCWTCAGSLPGIGRASPYFAPWASIHFQTSSGSVPSPAVTSTARPWP